MNRELEHTDDLIDLGAASTETKGAVGSPGDEIGLLKPTGLSDD
jgi:hypothetical protein